MDTFAKGNQPGQATDDFSSAYFITRNIIDHDGEITSEVVKEALIDWSEHPIFFDRFAGPTTRMAIRRYKGEEIPELLHPVFETGNQRCGHEDCTNRSV